MSEEEDIGIIAKKVQAKLREPITSEPLTHPLVDTKTVKKPADVNVVADGAAPKGKRTIPSKQGDTRYGDNTE